MCEVKRCVVCNKLKPLSAFSKHSGMWDNLDTRCKSCFAKYKREIRTIRKDAPPKPEFCECCGRPANSDDIYLRRRKVGLVMDHDPGKKIFRGWLCTHCNTGIGLLGDNIEGLKRALDYLYNVLKRLQ